jgi:hypothetical protein
MHVSVLLSCLTQSARSEHNPDHAPLVDPIPDVKLTRVCAGHRLGGAPAGIVPATPSLPWNHQEPLCGPPFAQVTPHREGRSYRFSFGQGMRSLPLPPISTSRGLSQPGSASRAAVVAVETALLRPAPPQADACAPHDQGCPLVDVNSCCRSRSIPSRRRSNANSNSNWSSQPEPTTDASSW